MRICVVWPRCAFHNKNGQLKICWSHTLCTTLTHISCHVFVLSGARRDASCLRFVGGIERCFFFLLSYFTPRATFFLSSTKTDQQLQLGQTKSVGAVAISWWRHFTPCKSKWSENIFRENIRHVRTAFWHKRFVTCPGASHQGAIYRFQLSNRKPRII